MPSLFFLSCFLLNRAENWVTEHLQLSSEITGCCFLPLLLLIHTFSSHFSGNTYYKQALSILVISAENYLKREIKTTLLQT